MRDECRQPIYPNSSILENPVRHVCVEVFLDHRCERVFHTTNCFLRIKLPILNYKEISNLPFHCRFRDSVPAAPPFRLPVSHSFSLSSFVVLLQVSGHLRASSTNRTSHWLPEDSFLPRVIRNSGSANVKIPFRPPVFYFSLLWEVDLLLEKLAYRIIFASFLSPILIRLKIFRNISGISKVHSP